MAVRWMCGKPRQYRFDSDKQTAWANIDITGNKSATQQNQRLFFTNIERTKIATSLSTLPRAVISWSKISLSIKTVIRSEVFHYAILGVGQSQRHI